MTIIWSVKKKPDLNFPLRSFKEKQYNLDHKAMHIFPWHVSSGMLNFRGHFGMAANTHHKSGHLTTFIIVSFSPLGWYDLIHATERFGTSSFIWVPFIYHPSGKIYNKWITWKCLWEVQTQKYFVNSLWSLSSCIWLVMINIKQGHELNPHKALRIWCDFTVTAAHGN